MPSGSTSAPENVVVTFCRDAADAALVAANVCGGLLRLLQLVCSGCACCCECSWFAYARAEGGQAPA